MDVRKTRERVSCFKTVILFSLFILLDLLNIDYKVAFADFSKLILCMLIAIKTELNPLVAL